jgi:hypothetical protein
MRCRYNGKHRYNQKYRPGPATLHKSLLFLKGAYDDRRSRITSDSIADYAVPAFFWQSVVRIFPKL